MQAFVGCFMTDESDYFWEDEYLIGGSPESVDTDSALLPLSQSPVELVQAAATAAEAGIKDLEQGVAPEDAFKVLTTYYFDLVQALVPTNKRTVLSKTSCLAFCRIFCPEKVGTRTPRRSQKDLNVMLKDELAQRKGLTVGELHQAARDAVAQVHSRRP
jgi:hypothetical protein